MSSLDRAHAIREQLTDARALAGALGLQAAPRATARQAMIVCPAHADRTPSCSVRLAKDGTIAVRCHGCGWTADALGLIAKVRGLTDFRDVLRAAADLANAPALAEPLEHVRKPADEPPGVSDEDYDQIWSFVLEACRPMRRVAPSVAGYLLRRGVFAEGEAAGLAGIPRDARALVGELTSNFDRSKLEAAGALRAGHAYWPLIIPWRDRFGRISCVQRRRLDDVVPKYLNPRGRSPRSPFGVEHLRVALDAGADEVVLVEGALDALARRRVARTRGERGAVLAVYSASSPAVGLPLDLLRGRRVVLALDVDGPGEAACGKLAAALTGVASELVRERVEGAKDWAAALAGAP